MMKFLWACVLLVVPPTLAALHPISPCPSVFSYEGTQPENERWYGIILLNTDESLVGVRIDIRLDRPAELLVAWMGTVTTEDNERFTILSLDQKLHPGPSTPSRIMVKFNAVKGSPQVRTIRLNGRQICPPDPNFGTEISHSNQDHLNENRYTTERVTRRPDLDFDDDWANSRPVPSPSRNPSVGDSYKPPKRPNTGGYSSSSENSGYNSHESHGGSGYNGQGNTHVGGNEREPVRTTTYGYDSHESYHNRRPSITVSHTNSTRPTDMDQQYHNLRPLVTEKTQYVNPDRPSISININKDVTYNVDSPDTQSYHPDSSGGSRPSVNRETPNINNNYPKTTERYHGQNVGGIREETHTKTTTKKPATVINSIHININNGDDQTEGSSFTPSKTSTKRPNTSSNHNNSKNNGTSYNNRQTTTRKPTYSSNQKPSSNNGYQTNRPNRNPDISSSESQYQTGYGQNSYDTNERTTERPIHQNQGTQTNHKPSEYEDSYRPSAVPSNRPSGSGGANNIPRPQSQNGQKEEGDLHVANSNVKCGQVAVNPAPLITHGQNTARGQWPWHIALYRIEGINLSYSCGGSLVSATVVITAAHCVTKAPRDRPVDADILVVQLGKYHLYQFSDDSVQNKQVRDVFVHPRYNSSNYLDDLAILVLSSPAEFTKFVRPVCLWPKHNFNLPNIDNKEGTVVGWGYDENNQVTEELKMARMPVVSYVTCLKSYPQFFSQFTAENKTFCAGFRQGTSVCNGDSGGGMVFQQDNVWYLRGLVSITVAKQGLRVCDTSHYVVFTDIANYFDWINQYLS